MSSAQTDLIYDWNDRGTERSFRPTKPIEFDDETLRDGLQCPSVTDPSIEDKIRILHLMNDLGIQSADIGLPGAGPRAVQDVLALTEEISRNRLAIRPNWCEAALVAL